MLLKPNAFSLHTSPSASCVLGTVLHVWRLCCGRGGAGIRQHLNHTKALSEAYSRQVSAVQR